VNGAGRDAKDGMPIQSEYEAAFQVCYGCGPRNPRGLQLKSYRQGDRVVAEFRPAAKHLGLEGFVYGGLIASLMDCHGMAAAAAYFRDLAPALSHAPRTVTASLKVSYRRPTPLGEHPLRLDAWVASATARKAVVEIELSVAGEITATGEVVAVQLPESMRT